LETESPCEVVDLVVEEDEESERQKTTLGLTNGVFDLIFCKNLRSSPEAGEREKQENKRRARKKKKSKRGRGGRRERTTEKKVRKEEAEREERKRKEE
jgi:hypothetical protein